jgi:hypothetical protein
VPENAGRPTGEVCLRDADCRNNTCALGHCVDLCTDTLDCPSGTACAVLPRVEAAGAMFSGCLQSHGILSWNIPVQSGVPSYLPIPDSARSVALSLSVDDSNQEVGVVHMVAPSGQVVIDNPIANYYTDPVRHRPEFGQSVLAMPSSPSTPLEPGAYLMDVRALRADGTMPGSAAPSATAVIKLDSSVILDLHFYFLNFDDHPCAQAFGPTLNAELAQAASFFQHDFLGQLRSIFLHGGIELGTLTYEDVRTHPELDGLDVADAPALLALGSHATGINVFFVRTLSPVGLQAYGPNPGPAGLAGTANSGIVVSLDTVCYRSWQTLARLTAHELARYMGLYDNVELDATHVDPIDDSDMSNTNLMFYSELGGQELSAGQRSILARSAVLR